MGLCSERRPGRGRACGRAAVLIAVVCAAAAPGAEAKVFYTQQQALALAFPTADRIEKRTYILTKAQVSRIESHARSALETQLVTIHTGWLGDEVLGHAHIDVHSVRTKPEGLMVVLDPAGGVRSVRVLAFHEPHDYLPAGRWYEQFHGATLDDGLRVGRDIHGIAGATLSARATTKGVRRALAYYRVLIRDEG